MFLIGFVLGALAMVLASDLGKKLDNIKKWNDNEK